MALTLRRAQSFINLDAVSAEDDFDVMDGPRRIGRIFRTKEGLEPWRWSLSTALVRAPAIRRAATRVQAVELLSSAYAMLGEKPLGRAPFGEPGKRRLSDVLERLNSPTPFE